MFGMRMILTICVALTFLFGSAVHAQDYARPGAYVGVGWSFAWDDFEDELDVPGVSADVDNSFGINVRLGYRAHPETFRANGTPLPLAIELDFSWYDDFEFDADVAGFGRILKGEVEAWSLMVNMKGYFLTGQFQPYAMVGVGVLDAEVSARDSLGLGLSVSDDFTEFAWKFSGGVDLYTGATASGDKVVVNVEAAYLYPTSDLDDLNFWTLGIGLQYRF
jgi:opacity protein-like surface antigen